MDYKAKYEALLEQMKSFTTDERGLVLICPSNLFPELQESEEEKTRKAIINYFECQKRDEPGRRDILNSWIEWLENQKSSEWDVKAQGCIEDAISACIATYGEDSYTAKWLKNLKPTTSKVIDI